MPNLPISQLPFLQSVSSDALFAIAQSGTTYATKAPFLANARLYGSFYHTSPQSGFTANQVYAVSASTSNVANGITVVDGTKFTVASASTYNLQFSLQLDKTQGGTAQKATIWLRKNGVDVPWTATDVTLANNNTLVVAAWNFVDTLDANGYFELMISVTDTHIIIYGFNPAGLIPGIPSAIVTMTQV